MPSRADIAPEAQRNEVPTGRIERIGRIAGGWPQRPPLALVVTGLVLGVALLVYVGRGMWFLADEWNFLLTRRELTPGNLLRPHNEHWLTWPVLIYRGLLALGGLTNYWPYYLTGLALHTLATVLAMALLRRLGVPRLPALLASLCLLLMGAAAEQIFSAFQLSWTAPVALFLASLLLLERPVRPRRAALGAAGLLLLAMPFGGVSLTLVLGLAAALILRREFVRAALVTGPALLAYLLWRVTWGVSPPLETEALPLLPAYVAHGMAASAAAFTGLPELLAGALLVVLVGALLVRGVRGGIPLTGWAAAFALLAFFASAGVVRVLTFGPVQAGSSRYLYLGALLLLLVLGAVAGPRALVRRPSVVVGASLVLAACLVVNVLALRVGAGEYRRLKGESAVRIVAADRLLAQGLAHVPVAQPDPHWAPDVNAEELLELRDDGIPIAYDGPYRVTDAVLDQERLALQVAFTPVEEVTADVQLVQSSAEVVPDGPGCWLVRADAEERLLVAASLGRFAMEAEADTVVHIRRVTDRREALVNTELTAGTRRQLELAVPASEDGAEGLLTITFPLEARVTLCGRTVSARS